MGQTYEATCRKRPDNKMDAHLDQTRVYTRIENAA